MYNFGKISLLLVLNFIFCVSGLGSDVALQPSDALCLSAVEGLDRVCARKPKSDLLCSHAELLAWHPDSCIVNKADDIFWEVVSLPSGGTIPRELLKKEFSHKLAQTLIFRHFQKYERPCIRSTDVSHPAYDFFNHTYSFMAFDGQIINKIINNGFLNQHQTGTSGGTLQGEWRASAEDQLADLKIEPWYNSDFLNSAHELRPKYSYAMFSAPDLGLTPKIMGSAYGNTHAVFKRETRKRTFIHANDTLRFRRNLDPPLVDPLITHFTMLDPRKPRTCSAGGVISEIEDPKQDVYGELLPPFTAKVYYELQIFGGLSLEDVDYFLVNCIPDLKFDYVRFVENLRKAGITTPVYTCRDIGKQVGMPVRFVRDRKL